MTETHTSSYLKRTNWPIFPTTSRAENTHGTAATQILTGPTASATSENRVLLLFLERKCSQAPQLQIFVLHKVLILLTLKSLICKNSSMIDLHFLSISSSDSEGFSCTGAGGASGLTGRNKKKAFGNGKSELFAKMTF